VMVVKAFAERPKEEEAAIERMPLIDPCAEPKVRVRLPPAASRENFREAVRNETRRRENTGSTGKGVLPI
jgi:hypothetical protein